jgi:D-tyrosyl-tRNA(Tyr) deacylase
MRSVLQRVARAEVRIGGETLSSIRKGLLVLLGIERGDRERDADDLCEKIVHLRIFDDEAGKMNLSLLDIGGEMLVVSQFTLLGDCRKGRRPSFTGAEDPDTARKLYDRFIARAEERGIRVAQGEFQAMMQVELVNHGPVTILLDSRKNFLRKDLSCPTETH